jgi:hypothetical protein
MNIYSGNSRFNKFYNYNSIVNHHIDLKSSINNLILFISQIELERSTIIKEVDTISIGTEKRWGRKRKVNV